MIVSMRKVRILGPRARLASVIRTLQDGAVVHLSQPTHEPPMTVLQPSARQIRHVAQVEAALDDIEEAVTRLGCESGDGIPLERPVEGLAREVRLARRARRIAVALTGEERKLEEERNRLEPLHRAGEVFASMGIPSTSPTTRTFFLILSEGGSEGGERLEGALSEAIGASFTLQEEPLTGNELAVALTV